MKIEVALAQAEGCRLETVELALGATVADALAASSFGTESFAAVAMFGDVVPPDRRLRDGDRVDLLPALIADPMAARRERAALKR